MRYTDTNICQIYVHTNISKTHVGVSTLYCSRTPTLTFFMLVSGMLVCQWLLVCWCRNAYVGVRNVGVRKYMLVSKLGRWLPTAVIYRHDESMHGVWFLSLWAAVCHASGRLCLRQTQFCPVTRIRRGRFSGCHGSMSKFSWLRKYHPAVHKKPATEMLVSYNICWCQAYVGIRTDMLVSNFSTP